MHTCEWNDCKVKFMEFDGLQNHIITQHIGRKVTRNLCLQCHWNDCVAQFHKRDHIISHLKIHLNYKPFLCNECPKAFKRPQDLKKHEMRRHKSCPSIHSDSRHNSEDKSETNMLDIVNLINTDESNLIQNENSNIYSFRLPTISFMIN